MSLFVDDMPHASGFLLGDMPHASGFLRAFQFPLLVPIKLTTREKSYSLGERGSHGCDHIVVGFTTTCAIGVYYY
jgi:hypothetical protein